MSGGPAEWDAEAYHRLAKPQEEWAEQVLERLPLGGDETVLDAGCGSGGVTRMLLERVPRGRVIGVDGSRAMIEEARTHLEQWADRVDLRVGDLLELDLEQPVDASFSNATFHWIPDHAQLFQRLRAAGFEQVRCWLEEKLVEPEDPRAFGATAGLAPHLERLPEADREAFVDAVMERLEQPIAFRYVRLNIDARAA